MLPNLLLLLCHQKLFYLLSASIRSPSKSSNLTYLYILFFSAQFATSAASDVGFYRADHHFRLKGFHRNIHGLSKLSVLSIPFGGCLRFLRPPGTCPVSPWKISVAFHNSSSAWIANLFLVYQPFYSFAFSLCNLWNHLLFSEARCNPRGVQSVSKWLWKCLFF